VSVEVDRRGAVAGTGVDCRAACREVEIAVRRVDEERVGGRRGEQPELQKVGSGYCGGPLASVIVTVPPLPNASV
jgi:hypothetical protein